MWRRFKDIFVEAVKVEKICNEGNYKLRSSG